MPVDVFARPEQLTLVGPSDAAAIGGQVHACVFQGGHTDVLVDAGLQAQRRSWFACWCGAGGTVGARAMPRGWLSPCQSCWRFRREADGRKIQKTYKSTHRRRLMTQGKKSTKALKRGTVSTAYLSLLASRGVDVIFGNAGTDFSPLIEAYAELEQQGAEVPRPIIATHENLAVTMAHGYGMISRKIPAVMVHVSVGTANLVCGAMNAARENVGILLTAGRTPLTEGGRLGARDGYIHWAQEMYDQAGMLREIVKWDYELRAADQLETVIDRAISIAASEPRGPVYLSLPREVLAEEGPEAISLAPRVAPAAAGAPDPRSLEAAARLLAAAKKPLIVTLQRGRLPSGFSALSAFAEAQAVPVIQHKPRYLSLPTTHPMYLGTEPKRMVPEADVILALECDVPWMPVQASPRAGAAIIHAGMDPLHTGIPIRGYGSDVTLTGDTALILEGLAAAMPAPSTSLLAQRRKWIEAHRKALDKETAGVRKMAATSAPIHAAWASHCLSEAKDKDAIVINEYTLMLDHACFDERTAISGRVQPRPRLGCGRGTWCQARGTRAAGDCGAGGRRLSLRQPRGRA